VLTTFILVFPWVFILSGGLLLLNGLLRWRKRRLQLANTTEVPGVVVANEEERKRKTRRYLARVRFTLPNGTPHEVLTHVPTDKPVYEEGETLTLRVRETHPEQALVADFWQIWYWPIILVGMGTLILGLGIWLLRSMQAALHLA